MEQSTLCMLRSLNGSHPTLLQIIGCAFRCSNDSEHFIATSVTVHSLYLLLILLLYIDSR